MEQPDASAGTLLLASQHLGWLTRPRIGMWWRQLATELADHFGPELGVPLALGLREAIQVVAVGIQEGKRVAA